MAVASFPWDLCRVDYGGYTIGADPDVERTQFDDGLVRQETNRTLPLELRSFRIIVKESNIAGFRAWLRANGNALFDFKNFETAAVVEAKIRGGYGSVQLTGVEGERLDGERIVEAQIELEFY